MKRLLNFGVADPLTLGMGHPIAERLQTLGRARPTTWRSRSLALSAMSVIAIASAPLSIAKTDSEVGMGTTLTVIPDFTDTKISELQARLNSLSSGRAGKETVTDFMMKDVSKFVANYNAADEIIDLKFSIPIKHVIEVKDSMPEFLQRCKSKGNDRFSVMRATYSWGSASVQCTDLPLPKPQAENRFSDSKE